MSSLLEKEIAKIPKRVNAMVKFLDKHYGTNWYKKIILSRLDMYVGLIYNKRKPGSCGCVGTQLERRYSTFIERNRL